MTRPPALLAVWSFFAGVLLLLVSAGLQVALVSNADNATDDSRIFLSLVLQGVALAAGMVLAAAVVLAIWSFATSDD